jgi:hypothetical protein
VVEVRIEGRRLDVFEGFDFSFNYGIADIRNPEKRSTEYSKTIKCPATKNNDELFGHIYDVNISNNYDANTTNISVNFNPNKKAEARVIADGVEVMAGVVQLRKIVQKGHAYTYEVVFIGKLVNIFSILGDKELNGLDDNGNPYIDFSDLDHQYDYGRITSSWTNTSGYVYPMIDYGVNQALFNQQGERIYRVSDFRPAVFLYDIIDRIFDFAGFTYTSTIFSSAFFRNLIIPFTNNGFKLTDQERQSREMVAALPVAQDITTDVQTDFVALLDFDGFQDPYNLWNDAGDYYECPASGFYTFSAVLTFETERTAAGQLSSYPFALGLRKYDLSSNSVFSLSSYAASANVSLSQFVGATAQTQVSFESQQVYLDAGDRIYLYLVVDPVQFQVANQQADLRMIQPSTFEAKVGDDAIIEGQTIPMNALVPEVEMKDLLMSIVNMFNLYILVDKDNEKNLFIETYNDFYAGGGVKDWTYKLARDKDITIEPLALLTDKTFIYTYSEDGDYYNDRYHNSYGRVYGDIKAIVDNDFLQSTNEISVVFSATPLVNDNPSNRIIAKIYDADIDEGAKETDSNIRILYYGGLLPSNPQWIFRYVQQNQNGYQTINVPQSFYPYAGHWNNPLTPTQDINFGLTKELYYASNAYTGLLQVTNANLFNVFHLDKFIDATSKDSKMMTGMFYLEPADINTLDFRDQIVIDNAYWRLNMVSDYNPFKEGLTKVELIKIIEKDKLKVETFTLGRPTTTSNGNQLVDAPISNRAKRSSNIFPEFQGTVKGADNVVGYSSTNFNVIGRGNVIAEGTDKVTITGDNNEVAAGLHNVQLINTNGVIVTQSNTTYINGKEQDNVEVLEGGLNEVRALNGGTNIFTVDGGEDIVQKQFSDTAIYTIEG